MRWFLIVLIFLSACTKGREAVPRSHQYPRLFLEASVYHKVSPLDCPFDFEIPKQSRLTKTDSRFADEGKHICWFDILWKDLGATLHCSYSEVNEESRLNKLIDDAFELASKHNVKALYRDETSIENGFGLKGLIFDISGPVASPFQFYITDEKQHFLRGSLYFNSKVDRDSLAPVLALLKKDVDHLLATLKFQ